MGKLVLMLHTKTCAHTHTCTHAHIHTLAHAHTSSSGQGSRGISCMHCNTQRSALGARPNAASTNPSTNSTCSSSSGAANSKHRVSAHGVLPQTSLAHRLTQAMP